MQRRFGRTKGASGFTNCSHAATKAARRLIRPFSSATMIDIVTRSPGAQVPRSGRRAVRLSRHSVTTIPTSFMKQRLVPRRALLCGGFHSVEKDVFDQDARRCQNPVPDGRPRRSFATSWRRRQQCSARSTHLAEPVHAARSRRPGVTDNHVSDQIMVAPASDERREG